MDASTELDSSVARLVCPVKGCQKHVKKAKGMLKHFKTHHPTKWILMCSQCSYVTRKIRHVDSHFKANHDTEEGNHLVCVCYSSCKLDEAMFKDWSFSVQYSCLLCSFNTENVKNFNAHNESHLTNGSESAEVSAEVKSEVETSEVIVNGSTENPESLDSSEIFHPILDFSYNNENLPSASSTELYPCPICGKGFTRRRSIKIHMVVHTDERTFHCSLCPYKARRKGDLDVHIDKTHRHQRPFSCHLCSKTFGFQTNLKQHLLSHSDNKGFECEHCNARFKFKSSVNKHFKRGCNTGIKTKRKRKKTY